MTGQTVRYCTSPKDCTTDARCSFNDRCMLAPNPFGPAPQGPFPCLPPEYSPYTPKEGDWVAIRVKLGEPANGGGQLSRYSDGRMTVIWPADILGPTSPPPEPKTPGQVAYETRVSFIDTHRIRWEDEPASAHLAWEAVAQAVLRH